MTEIIIISILNIFLIYVIYKQLSCRDKIEINVKYNKITTWIQILFFLIAHILILRGFKELHIKILLIITLSLAVYSNLISPFVVGIGQGHIYYSINRNFGTFPIHKLNINNIGVIKLTIKKDKDYVRLEILRTQVYQIYRLKDLDKLKNIFHGNKIIIDDRSKSR